MGKFHRVVSFLMAAALVLGFAAFTPKASAATQTYELAALLQDDQLKPLGRTVVNDDATGIRTDWSGSGFEIHVNTQGGTVSVGYESSYASYWVIQADGQQIWRGYAAKATSGGEFKAVIPSGSYTLSVIKETQIASSATGYFDLTTVAFDGSIGQRPADKELYIEFVGDSIACGDGALGEYVPGQAWLSAEDSATNSFAYYTAKALDADYSIVARGGIGLQGADAQEATTSTITMQEIYNYTSGYRDMNSGVEYDFARQPDVVVIELGANDGTGSMTDWTERITAFITQVREKNPDAAIVYVSRTSTHYKAVMDLIEAGLDDNLYDCHYNYHGYGSAALTSQKDGHPSAANQQQAADILTAFLREKVLKTETQEPEPAYNLEYYVSENGNDSNDGKTPETAKLTLSAAFTQAYKDNNSSYIFANGTGIRIWVEGTVVGSTVQAFGQVYHRYADETGADIPILITACGYDSATDNKAVLLHNYKPSNASSAVMPIYTSLTLQNLRIISCTNDAGTYCVYQMKAAGCDVVLDNVELTSDGLASNYVSWTASADPFVYSSSGDLSTRLEAGPVYSSLTFRNGDYTDLQFASAVSMSGLWASSGTHTSVPNLHTKLIIEDGAVMGNVYCAYGTMAVGSATVEIRGGTVENYYGTASGTASTDLKTYSTVAQQINCVVSGGTVSNFQGTGSYVTLSQSTDITNTITGGTIENTYYGTGSTLTMTGNVVNRISGGLILGSRFYGTGNTVTLTGGISNNMTGGEIRVTSDSAGQYGVFLAGGDALNVSGDVVNTISGGDMNVILNTSVDGGIYFGGRNGTKIGGNLINRVSGGNFTLLKGTGTPGGKGIWIGNYSGTITGTLRNEISGGCFDVTMTGGAYYLGGRSLTNYCSGIINILGVPDQPEEGPIFMGMAVYLGGNWGRLGGTSASMPADDYFSEDVLISNTIYGGCFYGTVYGGIGGNSKGNAGSNYVSYIKGSLKNEIYGGMFHSGIYSAGAGTNIYGNVTTDIYGGIFTSIYGGSNHAVIYGDVTTRIYAMREYYGTGASNVRIVAGSFDSSTSDDGYAPGTIHGDVTLHICPESYKDVVLKTPIYDCSYDSFGNGTIDGTVSVNISGGTFPVGLTLGGAQVLQNNIAGGSVVCGEDGYETTLEAAASAYATVRPQAEAAHSIYHCLCGNITASDLAGTDSVSRGQCLNNGKTGEEFAGCDGTILEWRPWESETSLPLDVEPGTTETNYYLVNDIVVAAQQSLGSTAVEKNITLRLDLNGKRINYNVPANRTDGFRVIVAFGHTSDSTYRTNLVITDASENQDGSVSIKLVENAVANANGGQILWVRRGDVDMYAGILDGSGANSTSAGAAVQIGSGNALNLYGGTIIGGNTTNNGGAVTVQSGGTLNLYNDAVIRDGSVKDSGGNIVVYGQMNMYGGSVLDGYSAKSNGHNVYVVAGTGSNVGSLYMSGGYINGGVNVYSSASDIQLSGSARITGADTNPNGLGITDLRLPTGITVQIPGTFTQEACIGISMKVPGIFTAEGCEAYADTFYSNAEGYGIAAAQGGALALSNTLVQVMDGNKAGAVYTDVTLAAEKAGEGYVKLLTDVTEDVAMDADLYLDLNGYTLTGDITGTGKLYGMDSTTDGYTCYDENNNLTCGKIVGQISVEVAMGELVSLPHASAARRYVAISAEDGVYTFHRIYLGITHQSLAPVSVSYGYKATFCADEMAAQYITGIGYELWAEVDGTDGSVKTFTDNAFESGKVLTLRVKNILREDSSYNAIGATAQIEAKAFLQLLIDGETVTIRSTENSSTLRDLVEKVNDTLAANADSYTQAQKEALRTMCEKFSQWMTDWRTESILSQ